MKACPRCGGSWLSCTCTDEQIRREAEEADWQRDYGFHEYCRNEADDFIKERRERERR